VETGESRPGGRRLTFILALTLLWLGCLIAPLGAAISAWQGHWFATRGIEAGSVSPAAGLGVNVRLDAEDPAARQHLALARTAGFTYLRQPLLWSEIEPAPGQFVWDTTDRIVALTREQGWKLIAVLTTSPAWARSSTLITAPPTDPATLAHFAETVARRYAGQVTAYQVWDEPNIRPHWGERYAAPVEYVALLRAVYPAIKRGDPAALVLAGGLAPTIETSEWNLNDVTYLDGIYRAGGALYFDTLAARALGFWSGPDDRRVAPDTLNFSRLILLRETMARHGDSQKPIWAITFGWNALPADWSGQPSPWGNDTPERQANRLWDALRRAREEWPWLPVIILPPLTDPTLAATDPAQGFLLLNPDGTPRPAFTTAEDFLRQPPARVNVSAVLTETQRRLWFWTVLAGAAALGAMAGLWRWLPRLPWSAWAARYRALPLAGQFALFLAAAALWQFGQPLPLALTGLLLFTLLGSLRLDLGLMTIVLTLPFYLDKRPITAGWSFSPAEALTLTLLVAWAGAILRQRDRPFASPRRLHTLLSPLGAAVQRIPAGLQWPLIAFVLAGTMAIAVAGERGIALREWRVNVIEPVIFFFLLCQVENHRTSTRLLWVFVIGAAGASLLGLYQYLFTDRVITAEGLRRMVGPYLSPNNLGLYLERALPVALTLFLSRDHENARTPGNSLRRIFTPAGLLTGAIGLALLLTFSLGAWLGAAAGLLVLAAWRGRRTLAITLLAGAIIAGVGLGIAGPERLLSRLGSGETSTRLVRVALWQSSAAMLADHPVTGVGLDQFLRLYSERYIRPEAWREPNLSHPHNLLLEWWVNLGMAGPVILLTFLGWIAQQLRGWRRRPAGSPVLLAGVIAALVAALTHSLVDRFYFGAPDLAFVFFLFLDQFHKLTCQQRPGVVK